MPQVAVPIAISAVAAGASSGIAAGISGGVSAGFSAALIAGTIGAAVGALGLLIKPKQPRSRRHVDDLDVSTTLRTTPVAVGFGRFRAWGNYVSIGGFGGLKDRLESDIPGRRLRRIHAMLGIAEGALQWATNFFMDGKAMKEHMRAENVTEGDSYAKYWIGTEAISMLPGTTSESVDTMVSDANSKMPTPHIPWRRLGKLKLHCVVGDVPKIPSFNGDFVGPDYSLSASGNTGGSGVLDAPMRAGYDAHHEEWWWYNSTYNLMVHYPRRATVTGTTEATTDAPTGVTTSNGWFFGRHNIVLYQDSSDLQKFWFGSRGMAAASTEWEAFRVDPQLGYANQIRLSCVDERHQILHTLHKDTTANVRYIQRLWPLTGRVDRINLEIADATTWRAMTYSVDLDAYVIVADSNFYLVDPVSGKTRVSASPSGAASTVGLCVSGTRVGMIANGSMAYYDPILGTSETGYGTSGGTFSTGGDLGGVTLANQNTWTGHVTAWKNGTGCVMFFPSVAELTDDVSCVGTPGGVEDQDFVGGGSPFFLGDKTNAFFRDWSYLDTADVSLKMLKSRSSLAQALWASSVDETTLQNGRWGGGLPAKYFSLSSAESVHGYCVGAIRFTKGDGVTHRYAERAKFDYLLSQRMSLNSFITDEVLSCVNGNRAVFDGKLHFDVPRRGLFPQWHFSGAQIKDGTLTLAFTGKTGGINRVEVQYVDVRDDYRNNFALASNDFHQTVTGVARQDTTTHQGIGRFNHAEWLAKQILDNNSYMRRQVEFSVNGHLGWLIVPGDGIEVTHEGTGLKRVLFRVTTVTQDDDGDVKISATEHRRMLESVRGTTVGNVVDVDDPDDGDDPDGSQPETGPGPLSGDAFWFANGAIFEAGNYRLDYLYGAWKPSGGGWTGYTQFGYNIITRVSGVQVILADAPGINIASPGYASIAACEAANAGQTTAFTLTTAGKIGIKLKPSFASLVSFPQPRPRPTFALYDA